MTYSYEEDVFDFLRHDCSFKGTCKVFEFEEWKFK